MCKRYSFLFLAVFFLLTGCNSVTLADPEASQEYSRDVVGKLEPGKILGQTVSAQNDHLNGVYLWLRTKGKANSSSTGTLTLRLFANPHDTESLAAVTIAQSAIASNGPTYIRFDIPSTTASQPVNFFTLDGDGDPIEVLGRREDAYPGGTLYQSLNGTLTPVNADIAFRLTYEYGSAMFSRDLLAAIPHLWLALPLLVILVVPGWLLLTLGGMGKNHDFGERFALSAGLSLAVIPLVFLWSSTAGIRWNAGILVGIALAVASLLVWRWRKNGLPMKMPAWQPTTIENLAAAILPAAALMSIFSMSLIVRLVMVRDLAAPAWVDSVHHAAITRLILEHGRFPETYLPYMNITAQEYHAGYHTGLAAFVSLSGMELTQGMLIYGQILNALIVFAVYALAKFLSGDQRAGLVAGLVAGLMTSMPAYYTSWGRYTQLAGLLILPAVIILFQKLIEPEQTRITRIIRLSLTTIATGGLFIVHYRVAAYTGLFLLALFFCGFRLKKAWNVSHIRRTAGWGAAAAGAALLVTLPWTWPTIAEVFAPIVASGSHPGTVFGDFSWTYLTAAMGKSALAMASVGLAWGVLRGKRWAAALALWVGLLLLMANLGPLGVPGASIFSNNTSVAIIFFMPMAVLAGYAVSQAYEFGQGWIPAVWVKVIQWILTLLIIWLALVSSAKLTPILRSSTLLFRAADASAMDWIRTNIPPDETVLINPFSWGYNLYAGSDGGFWISGLAGRKTMPPPVLYSMGPREEVRQINATCQQVIANGTNAEALWEIMLAQNIHYVYVGGRGGPISPLALNASPLFITLYEQDGTWVFETVNVP